MAALADFAKYVRPEVPGCPEPLITDAVLRACIDFCTRTELLSEIIELPTEATVATYAITPTDPELYPARLRNVLKNKLPLDKTDAATHAVSRERHDSRSPEKYFAPTRKQITFAPVPDSVETIELDLVLRPDRDATTVPDVLFDEWATAIASGAKSLLQMMEGSAWANAALGAYHKTNYDADVATAAVQAAMGNVGGAMHVAITPI